MAKTASGKTAEPGCLELFRFADSDLFRISDFGFRISGRRLCCFW